MLQWPLAYTTNGGSDNGTVVIVTVAMMLYEIAVPVGGVQGHDTGGASAAIHLVTREWLLQISFFQFSSFYDWWWEWWQCSYYILKLDPVTN